MALVIEQKARAIMNYTGRIKWFRRLEDVLLIHPLTVDIDVRTHNPRHGRRQAGAVLERPGWRQSASIAREYFRKREINPGITAFVVGIHRDVEIATVLPDPCNGRAFHRLRFKFPLGI